MKPPTLPPASDDAGNAGLRRTAAERLNEIGGDLYELTPILHHAVLDQTAASVSHLARLCEALADALMSDSPAPERVLCGRRLP